MRFHSGYTRTHQQWRHCLQLWRGSPGGALTTSTLAHGAAEISSANLLQLLRTRPTFALVSTRREGSDGPERGRATISEGDFVEEVAKPLSKAFSGWRLPATSRETGGGMFPVRSRRQVHPFERDGFGMVPRPTCHRMVRGGMVVGSESSCVLG